MNEQSDNKSETGEPHGNKPHAFKKKGGDKNKSLNRLPMSSSEE